MASIPLRTISGLNAKHADGSPYDPWVWQDTFGFSSRHNGGANFGFADGSVHFVADGIDLATYRALATIRGGEAVSPP